MPTPPARHPTAPDPWRLRQHLLACLVLNTAIALGITVVENDSFFVNWVYSQCIGTAIWGAIDLLRDRFAPDEHPDRRQLLWLVPAGVVLGYSVGVTLANALLGHSNWLYWTQDWRRSLGFLLMSLGIGAAFAYDATQRAQRALAEAQAQAALRQSTQAQLQLLQSQLEPHMLFNTLANLRALIGLDPQRAQSMLDHLVAYLRATLDASRATEHTLAQEFERLRDYLELMQVRMGARLHYQLSLPPELAGLSVPPLLLQSLVENALQHGLEPQLQGGSVHISAAREGHLLHLRVDDDGAGPSTDLNAPESTAQRFGVSQVRQRLATRYGPQGTLIFVAPPQGGTSARVQIPLETPSA